MSQMPPLAEQVCARQVIQPPLTLEPVRTEWVVLTGAQCAGKTTSGEILRDLGLPFVHDQLREYAPGVRERDIPLLNHVLRAYLLQHTRAATMLDWHLGADPDRLTVLDRGFGDVLGAFEVLKLGPPGRSREFNQALHNLESWAGVFRYKAVFFLDPVPRFRSEDRRVPKVFQHLLSRAVLKGWRSLGYDPIRIPFNPDPVERAHSILERLASGPGSNRTDARLLPCPSEETGTIG